jgi:FtsH-binding integral membrane protein
MKTNTARATPEIRNAHARLRGFYLGIAIVCGAIAMAGFIPVYYSPVLRGTATFPLRLHSHATVATLWLLLLVSQTGLIWSRHRRLHMQLGVAALVVATLMVPLTVWAIAGMLTRHDPPGALERAVFFPQVVSLLLFFSWIVAGFLKRRDAESHKRYMIMATIVLLGTPIARIELWGINEQPLLMLALWLGPALVLVLHDIWSRRRLHRVTALCVSLLLSMQIATVILMENAAWGAIVTRIAETLRTI